MSYLDFLDSHYQKDLERAEQKVPEVQTVKPLPKVNNDCKHDSVLGDPQSGGICLDCNAHLTKKEMEQHR